MKNWTNLNRVSPPATDLFELEKVMTYTRASEDEEDVITDLIAAAIAYVEGPDGIGVVLQTSEWRASYDTLPGLIQIGLRPIQSVDSVTYVDAAGDVQTLDPTLYYVDVDQRPAIIAARAPRPSTADIPGAVKVHFTAGYGNDVNDVPADLRQAILLLVGHWYENREAASPTEQRAIPHGVDRILSKYRVAAFF